jgi:hypothetical protein
VCTGTTVGALKRGIIKVLQCSGSMCADDASTPHTQLRVPFTTAWYRAVIDALCEGNGNEQSSELSNCKENLTFSDSLFKVIYCISSEIDQTLTFSGSLSKINDGISSDIVNVVHNNSGSCGPCNVY